MKIAVLGWGSLIWCPKDLKIKDKNWKEDGPKLPIEFARISKDRRLTLVIYNKYINEKKNWVQTLWNIMDVESIGEAIVNLGTREGASCKRIGFIYNGSQNLREDFVNKKTYCYKVDSKNLDITEDDYYYNFENLNEEQKKEYNNSIIYTIAKWMKDKKLDGVVWTELSANFIDETNYDELNSETAINYLRDLDEDRLKNVKEYILLTPKQIQTRLRREMEDELNKLNNDAKKGEL